MRVMVWAAHPDDEWLGVGGTLLRHLDDGDAVYIRLHDRCRQPDWSRPEALARAIGAVFGLDEAPWAPDVLYTHHPGDLNAHHRAVAEQAFVAGRYVPVVRTFETVSSTEWGLAPFLPDHYVAIDIERKLDLLARFYDDELRAFPHPRSTVAIEALARWRGSTAGLSAAEAFHTIHSW